MNRRIAGLTLVLCLLAPTVGAEPIPIEQLKKDFDSCSADRPAEIEATAWTNYCRCMNSGVQRTFSYEEYQNLVTGFSTDAVADRTLMDRFFAIVATCKAALPAAPATQ